MPLTFSPLISPQSRGDGHALSVQSIDLLAAGIRKSPIILFDDFLVQGHPFGPHPHAGFSAVTYVFEDSPGRLRGVDSLGNDHVVGPGGIVWSQAANGMMHEEMLADPGLQLHGLQFFVNLGGANKTIPAQVFALNGDQVPVWTGSGGDTVYVVVGDYKGMSSPLRPAEPFCFLDIELSDGVEVELPKDWIGLIYSRYGATEITHAGGQITLPIGKAVALEGSGALRLETNGQARPLFFAAPIVNESIVQQGPFIMRNHAEIQAAIERFKRGEMGQLRPYRPWSDSPQRPHP